jgi:hypothetical protein
MNGMLTSLTISNMWHIAPCFWLHYGGCSLSFWHVIGAVSALIGVFSRPFYTPNRMPNRMPNRFFGVFMARLAGPHTGVGTGSLPWLHGPLQRVFKGV